MHGLSSVEFSMGESVNKQIPAGSEVQILHIYCITNTKSKVMMMMMMMMMIIIIIIIIIIHFSAVDIH